MDRHRSLSAGLAAIASSLFPGLGQLATRRRRVASALIIIDALLLIGAGVLFLVSPTTALKWWVSPGALFGLFALNIAILAYRGGASIDAFQHADGRRWFDWAGVALALLLVVAPHALAANLIATQNDLIATVFGGDPDAAPGTTVPDLTTLPPIGESTASSTTAAPTTTATPRFWDGTERLNVMLLGSDAGVGRIGTRTDTIILVSINPSNGDMAMFSIPRNLTEAPLPEGMGVWDCNCFPDIITHLWANGEWYPDAFPGPQAPSVNALKAAIGLIFDLEVHYYAKVDLVGFAGLVDALGGVEIDVPERLVDEEYPSEDGGTEYIEFEPGVQHMDGHQALAYSRIRRHSGDFARMHRQRCVVGAILEQTSPFDVLARYGQLADAIKEHVETDIPIEALGDMVELLPLLDGSRTATLRITRYNYGSSGHAGYQLYDLERIRQDAMLLMEDPTLHLETQDGLGLDDTCDQSFD